MDNRLNTLGLAYRAKKIVLGEEVLNQIKLVKLMIISSNISDKSRERFLKKCHYYNIDYIDEFDYETISKALGKENVKVVGIVDEGFAKSILKK